LGAGRALAAARVALLQGSVDAGLPDLIRHCGLGASEEPEAEGDDENSAHFQFPDVLAIVRRTLDRFAECSAASSQSKRLLHRFALLLPGALLILNGFRRRAHGGLADLACRETSLLAIVEAPLVADDSAIRCGGSLIDGGESGEAREAESNDENFAHFQFP
jgi:hypothetical protein